MVDVDCHWQQFDTPCSLISALQWLHRPCSRLSWFSMVGKRLPVKAYLAIHMHSPVSGVSVWCQSLAFMQSYKWISILVQLGMIFANPVIYNDSTIPVVCYICWGYVRDYTSTVAPVGWDLCFPKVQIPTFPHLSPYMW